MGRAVFVSYKHNDNQVERLHVNFPTTARDYVDEIVELIGEEHVYKGEEDGEDLSDKSEEEIKKHLSDKIFYSSVTIVLISKEMQESGKAERNQYIPWEIAYSLKNNTRSNGVSRPNGVLGVVLPDQLGRYDHALRYDINCRITEPVDTNLFPIIVKNTRNLRNAPKRRCNGKYIYHGEHSYIKVVKWSDFKYNWTQLIETVQKIRENGDAYDLYKTPEG